ncbi:DUF4259 domain-containing protein [Streptomyces griseoviridis]|jgi:hypothetical protein|uniref:DUF4259 domain-containing protein n=3 Tax=Streptomyces TaxID=1883 RepID=A0A918G4I0_STRGD|nr:MULTISPECIES: DUF4259 domain-containing protein [Streptomyces]MDP9682028.1 hypothetical protein [Streptomyces griseoviridis]GGS16706.1 hypothetical protein GCM10010238_00670 [Streptomyces niveoruber]GGT02987.1 hypothetical protein GCM10010240_40470 [Streptomyces griseoviridis]GGU35134.1 hypothetical protein GCM10010259_27050 [Streptomyces daghestanicus]GHI33972.1 hypothetical protein Sdagh_57020 [Streptomyces daghestanicus]
MGTWGSGNFESDTALDHLSLVTDRLVTDITDAMTGDPVALEPDEYWGVAVPCNVELLHTLAQAGRTTGLPAPETIESWKRTFMAIWERAIDELEPSPAHKEQRRAVLHRTFDDLTEDARREAAH